MKRFRSVILLVASGICAILALFFLFRVRSLFEKQPYSHDAAIKSASNISLPDLSQEFAQCVANTTASNSVKFAQCAKEWFGARGGVKDLSQALSIVHALFSSKKILREQCHTLEHVVAEMAVEEKGNDVAVLFAACDTVGFSCRGGCYEGVPQAAVRQYGPLNGVFERFSVLCAGAKDNVVSAQVSAHCFHGLGRGFADIFPHDFLRSLPACKRVTADPDNQYQCVRGVFMKAALPDFLTGFLPPDFHRDDPFFPCSTVPKEYQEACYADSGQRFIYSGGKIEDAAEICARVPQEEWREECRTETYRAVALKQKPAQKRRSECLSFGKYAKECFAKVVRELINTPYYTREYLEVFCADLPEPEGSSCRGDTRL